MSNGVRLTQESFEKQAMGSAKTRLQLKKQLGALKVLAFYGDKAAQEGLASVKPPKHHTLEFCAHFRIYREMWCAFFDSHEFWFSQADFFTKYRYLIREDLILDFLNLLNVKFPPAREEGGAEEKREDEDRQKIWLKAEIAGYYLFRKYMRQQDFQRALTFLQTFCTENESWWKIFADNLNKIYSQNSEKCKKRIAKSFIGDFSRNFPEEQENRAVSILSDRVIRAYCDKKNFKKGLRFLVKFRPQDDWNWSYFGMLLAIEGVMEGDVEFKTFAKTIKEHFPDRNWLVDSLRGDLVQEESEDNLGACFRCLIS